MTVVLVVACVVWLTMAVYYRISWSRESERVRVILQVIHKHGLEEQFLAALDKELEVKRARTQGGKQ